MQWQLLTLCCCLLASTVVLGSPVSQEVNEPIVHKEHHQLLGAKECTWGPSYWCYNITNAKGCNAVTHCIQTVWEKHAVPEDHDSICDICLDMVEQARDQLRSNMTQEDLKAVFEGSCKLIPIKAVAKECIKLADDFIPELVEALSSQMNPQAVCSVAGLCNNAAIDRMLEDEAATKRLAVVPLASSADTFTCAKCNSIGGIIAQKFHSADRDSVLEAMLRQCGQMSSFSDACSNIVLTYFNEIYANLKNTLNRETICHMSGVCAAQFHQHDDDVTAEDLQKSMSSVVGAVNDDIPCELCKQLVHHLKDLLIANTTELEFKQVMEGLCKQTKSFQSECLSIVDNYYVTIYQTLVADLNENEACCAIQICPRGLTAARAAAAGIAPLLPAVQAARLDVHITAKPRLTKKKFLGEGEPVLTDSQIARSQLPFDTLNAPHAAGLVEGGSLCSMCEYVTKYVATELADPTIDDDIKSLMKTACAMMPAFNPMCGAFVDNYGDAIIALFAMAADPNTICPVLDFCAAPAKKDVEVVFPMPVKMDAGGISVNGQSGSEKCPMCLFAVAQAQAAVKKDKSVDNIKYVLNRLCVKLPSKMQLECNDFVETYTRELVQMLANDFSAEAICIQLDLCDPKKSTKPLALEPIATNYGGGVIETNEIPDSTFNGIEMESIRIDNKLSPNCLLCEEVVNEVEKHISNKKSRDQIKKSLEHACGRLHKIESKCTALVEKYGDKIVDLIMGEITPKQICRVLGQCIFIAEVEMVRTNEQPQPITSAVDDFFVPNIEQELYDGNTAYIHANGANPTICVLCQTVMTKLEAELKDASTQKEIEDAVKNICHKLPKSYDTQCSQFVDSYATLIITLLDSTPPKQICGQLSLCSPPPVAESKLEVLECAVCHAATQQLIRVLEDPKTERSIENVVEKVCPWLPGQYNSRCVKLIEIYGHSMMTIISRGELQTVCTQIGMCFADEYASFAQVVSMGGQ